MFSILLCPYVLKEKSKNCKPKSVNHNKRNYSRRKELYLQLKFSCKLIFDKQLKL